MPALHKAHCFLILLLGAGPGLSAANCNSGQEDAAGEVGSGPDCDQNGIPDECDLAGKFVFSGSMFGLGLEDPAFLAAADLDRDGVADILSLDRSSEKLSLLVNTGGGLEFELRGVDLPAIPAGLAAADFDGDDLADLALLRSSSVDVLRNAGDLSFLPSQAIPLPVEPTAIIAVDLDLDGDMDLAATGRVGLDLTDGLSLLANDGAGRFSPARNFAICEGARWPAAGDLDGDGDLDLVVACDGKRTPDPDEDEDTPFDPWSGSGGISILRNDGGSFGPALGFDPGMRPRWIDIGDLDGDGDGDLVAAGTGADWQAGFLLMALRSSGGVFEPGAPIIETGPPLSAALDDLDGDGDRDIAVARMDFNRIDLFANDGSGSLAGGVSLPVAGSPRFLLAADLDADGDRDLATASGGPVAVSVLLNEGRLAFGPRLEVVAGRQPGSVAALDLDGDGDLDMSVTSKVSREVTFLWNEGAPAFPRATFHLRASGPHPLMTATDEIELADFDGDGHIDLAGCAGPLRIEWGDGAGRFGGAIEVPASSGLLSFAPGDFDGDGMLDMAGAAPSPGHRILIFQNRVGRVFAAPRIIHASGSPRSIVPGDLDGDGDLDLAATLENAGVQAFLNDGGASLRAVSPLVPEGVYSFWSIGAADLDLDGDLELMLPANSPNRVFLLWNRGDASFEETSTSHLPHGPGFVSAADLDGDGDPELFTTNFFVLDNRAGFAGVPWQELGMEFFAMNIAAGDFDGNGRLDLASYAPRGALILFNASSPPGQTDADRDGIPDKCERVPFHRGDPEADGKIDLADAISILNFLFAGGQIPGCLESADADNDGSIIITDAIHLLGFLFLGGPEPALPGPVTLPCGPDPDPEGSMGDLGCDSYPACVSA